MKIQHLIPILFLAAFCTVSAQTNSSKNETINGWKPASDWRLVVSTNLDLTKPLSDVLNAVGKIYLGGTRAAITNDFYFYQVGNLSDGPLGPDKFQEHLRYTYRGCYLIKIDVDFVRSTSEKAQPTDIIAKISAPYIQSNYP